MSDFDTGMPLNAEDLWFLDEFIESLSEMLRTEHVLLTAPRRKCDFAADCSKLWWREYYA